MKHILSLFTLLACCNIVISQDVTGSQLLDKAITYHDSNNNWPTFNGTFNVVMKTPNSADRATEVMINLPQESFHAIATKDGETTTYLLTNGECVILEADAKRIADLETQPKRSHCETTSLYSNYYTYLYGLPMKLKDPGTNIDPKVEHKTFKGKDYLVLKATYDEAVGSDVWYFYFNPDTYAMEIYQFFKTDENGTIKPDSGEYILLTEEATVNAIKMPKTRAWYYNKDDKYLGTDDIKQ